MCTISLRMNGPTDSVNLVRNALDGLRGVDRVEELGVAGARLREESDSSAPDEKRGVDARSVEIHAVDDATAQVVRGRVEIAAHNAGVVVEWLERF